MGGWATGPGTMVLLLLAALLVAAQANEGAPKGCPVASAMKDFDLEKFTGDWYVLEYEYPKKMDLHALSCIGLHYSLTGYDSVVTNFTFRFPAKTGHFYHLPTFALVTDDSRAVWEMQFRGVDLVSLVVDTDYHNWAVLVQCHDQGGQRRFLSTRVLARERSLGAQHWIRAEQAVEAAQARAPFRYPIDQGTCGELDEEEDALIV